MSFLRVKRLTKSFGGLVAIEDVGFSVPEGAVFSVIGPNGAGKTTLFNLLTGIYRPDSGSVTFGGSELVGLPPHGIAALGMTRTFQNLQIFTNMSVMENVMAGCHLRCRSGLLAAALRLPGVLREEGIVRKEAVDVLAFCGLSDMARQEASSLPYGALKRLEIARALAMRPKLLLLDEPAGGLNDSETMALASLIGRIRDSGTTVLLVEHHMGLVMKISDTILVLHYGRQLAEGPPQEIQRNPNVISAYLGG